MIKTKIEVRDRSIKQRDLSSHLRVYFFHDDESVVENFGNRMARPRDLYATFLPDIAEKHLGLPRTTKFKWSQYAGCSCPCSPGFICKEIRGKDVYVHLEEAPKVNNNFEEVQLANQRSAGLVRQLAAEAKQ